MYLNAHHLDASVGHLVVLNLPKNGIKSGGESRAYEGSTRERKKEGGLDGLERKGGRWEIGNRDFFE